MRIVQEKIGIAKLVQEAKNLLQGEAVKGVVDVGQGILAVDEPMHADIERLLLENGSNQYDLWGINLHSDPDEDMIEYDSMINIRPVDGNRSRGVDDPGLRAKIEQIVREVVA